MTTELFKRAKPDGERAEDAGTPAEIDRLQAILPAEAATVSWRDFGHVFLCNGHAAKCNVRVRAHGRRNVHGAVAEWVESAR